MGLIAAVAASLAVGVVPVVKTVLGASDTLAFTPGQSQTLIIENDTGAPVTVVIDGADAVQFVPGGIGSAVDLTAGFQVTIPDGAGRAVALKNIQRYLSGVVTVTGGDGATAYILS